MRRGIALVVDFATRRPGLESAVYSTRRNVLLTASPEHGWYPLYAGDRGNGEQHDRFRASGSRPRRSAKCPARSVALWVTSILEPPDSGGCRIEERDFGRLEVCVAIPGGLARL